MISLYICFMYESKDRLLCTGSNVEFEGRLTADSILPIRKRLAELTKSPLDKVVIVSITRLDQVDIAV